MASKLLVKKSQKLFKLYEKLKLAEDALSAEMQPFLTEASSEKDIAALQGLVELIPPKSMLSRKIYQRINELADEDEELIKSSNELEARYAEAAAFDAANFDKWVRDKFVVLCTRTNYPKLGYFIHILNENEIPCLLHGESCHAPLLWVQKENETTADTLTISVPGLDDIPDDNERFAKYAHVAPDPELLE